MVAVADLLVGLGRLVVEDGRVVVEELLALGVVLTTGAERVPADPGSPEQPLTSARATTPEAAAAPAKVRPGPLRLGWTGARGIPHCA